MIRKLTPVVFTGVNFLGYNVCMTNTEKLRSIMDSHKMTAAEVAAILKRSPATVRIWRCRNPARTITDQALRLLELELEARTVRAGGK